MQMKKQASGDERKRQKDDDRSPSPPTPYMAVVHSHSAAPLAPGTPVQKVPLQFQEIGRDSRHLKPYLQDILDSSEQCFPKTNGPEEHSSSKSAPDDKTALSRVPSAPHPQANETGSPLSELEEIPCTNLGSTLPAAATLIRITDLFSGIGKRKRNDSSDEQSSTDEDKEDAKEFDDIDTDIAPGEGAQPQAQQQEAPCPLEDQWSERFKELSDFKEQMGHCSVPHNYEGNPALARWVKRQRHQYKQLRLDMGSGDHLTSPTKERIKALEDLGFVFDCQRTAWDERLVELREYHNSFLDCSVPSNYPTNPGLAMWVKCQRRQYKLYKDGKKSSMTPQRLRQLEALGFAWEARKEPKKGRRKKG